MNNALFTSKTGLWETPQEFFDKLNREFDFTLDACATPEQDGLSMPWNGRVWCNPPYGRQVGQRVKKAYMSAQTGAIVVMLLPARTDTAWFHDYIYRRAEIRFVRGRLKFGGSRNSAPFPSMVCVFRGGTR